MAGLVSSHKGCPPTSAHAAFHPLPAGALPSITSLLLIVQAAALRGGRGTTTRSQNQTLLAPIQNALKQLIAQVLTHLPSLTTTLPRGTCRSLFLCTAMCWLAALPSAEAADVSMPPTGRRRTGRNTDKSGRGEENGKKQQRSKKLLTASQMKQDLEDPFDIEEMKALFPVLVKMVLNNSMKIRQQEAILLTTLVVPEGLKSVTKAQARVRQWLAKSDAIRTEGTDLDNKMLQIGSLSAACFAGILEGLSEEGEAVGRANATGLRTLNGKLEQMQVQEVFQAIAFCKMTPAFADGHLKLQYHIKGLETKCLEDALVQCGAQLKQGVAPYGPLGAGLAHQAFCAHGRRHLSGGTEVAHTLVQDTGSQCPDTADSQCPPPGQKGRLSREAWRKEMACKIAVPALLGKPPRYSQKRVLEFDSVSAFADAERSAVAAKHVRTLGGVRAMRHCCWGSSGATGSHVACAPAAA